MKWLIFFVLCLLLLRRVHTAIGEDELDLNYNSDQGDCTCELEVYEAEVEHAIIKSPNYPNFDGCDGKCIYRILPHPNKSVSLYTSQSEITSRSSLVIYALIEKDGRYVHLLLARIKKPNSYYYYSSSEQSFPGFVSAKNVGFEVQFTSHTDSYYTNFKMSFDRNYEYDEICDFPIKAVSENETLIQRDHQFRQASGCVYRLVPEIIDSDTDEEDEMLLSIGESEDGVVAIRTLDENGRLVFNEPSRKARQVLVSAFDVQILSHKSSKSNGLYKLPKITAKLVKKKCQCEEGDYTFDLTRRDLLTLHSPGYPDLYCPKKQCSHEIKVTNAPTDDDRMCLFEVKIKAVIGAKDTFAIRSGERSYLEVPHYKSQAVHINEKFVIKAQPVTVIYASYDEHTMRNYEVNITRIKINADCFCNFFKDKTLDYGRESSFEVTFPSHCDFFYCNFQMKDIYYWQASRSIVEFQLENALEGDVLTIRDEKHTEKYTGSTLHHYKRHEIIRATDITLARDKLNATEPATFRFNYKKIENSEVCSRDPQQLTADIEQPAIIISPGYPQNYQNDQTCEFIVTVPENCRMALSIDEISVENFHDYVKIYEGNSTDGKLIKSYTAYAHHEVINITSKTALIVFITDQSTSDRGFHITATAHIIMDEPDDHYLARTLILIGLGVIVIIGIVIVIFTYETHIKPMFQNNNNDQGGVDRQPDAHQEQQPQAVPEPELLF
ncbi:unnamed protein product [Caenorhabditis brenneri]